jgi:hypothetical protein
MIERLKSEVLKKFGSQLLYTKACRILATEILEETGARISTTTIRRVFGFLKTSTSPAKYTLNTLALYVGYQSWEEFTSVKHFVPLASDQHKRNWNDLYEKALAFSKETYKFVLGQSGIPFQAVVNRSHAEERIGDFLNSSKMALSFVAPGGYGKSSMLAKWFEKNWIDNHEKDVILYLNASFMLDFMKNDFRLEQWIQDQLVLEEKDNLTYFLENPEACESRIIFVIDALDEITYDNGKLEHLFLYLKQFITNYNESNRVKLIITSRNSTWEKFALPFVLKGNSIHSSWYELSLNIDSQDHQNLLPLNDGEIQYVIDRTIKEYSADFSLGELSFRQRKMISNPFFLELFVRLYKRNKKFECSEGQELMQEFLQNKIFYSRFSEEKMDILHGILNLIGHGKNDSAVKKIDLRSLFPIHLKTAGNYFSAYEELVSYGLLTEFISTDRYHSYCKYVKITSEQLFETLIGMDLIQQHGGIDFRLIKSVDEDYAGYECKNRLICFLYSSAILDGKYRELKNFFQLSEDTLSDPQVMDTVFNSSAFGDHQKMELVEHFLKDERIEKFLLSNFRNIHNFNQGNSAILDLMAKQESSKNIRMKSLSILLLDSVFRLDIETATHYYEKLQCEEVDDLSSGFDISIRLASNLLYNYFISKKSNDIDILRMFYHREMAYNQSGVEQSVLNGEFELILCIVLIYMKSFHKVLQLIEDVEYLYKNSSLKQSSLNYKILQCYKLTAQQSLGMKMSTSQIDFFKACEDDILNSKNYFLQIYYYSFYISLEHAAENRGQVERCFNAVLEICEEANYKLCSAAILHKMAKYYYEWDENIKEEICLSERKAILKDSIAVFDRESLFV